MKTADLLPPLLDLWVARALGAKDVPTSADWHWMVDVGGPTQRLEFHSCPKAEWRPSTNPSHGQPIIEREHITTMWTGAEWHAAVGDYIPMLDNDPPQGRGPTALIAAMRAFVASKMGETVPDEEMS